MPDFIRLTDHPDGCKVVIVTSAIGAVKRYKYELTKVLVQGQWIVVVEPEHYVLAMIGVPKHRTVIDERDVPLHQLPDEVLVLAWRQWAERKNVHSLPVATMIEIELHRRGVEVKPEGSEE